jgi:hypothetical protein
LSTAEAIAGGSVRPAGDGRSVAFFAVSNARDFLAVVALVNSLRRVGHDEPFYLVDCGLTDEQRSLLERHVQLLAPPGRTAPALLKFYGPQQVNVDVAVVLDADVILTKPLAPLVGDKPVVFADPIEARFHSRWNELGFGEVKPVRTVNSGHLIAPTSSGFLPRLQEGIERMVEIVRRDPATVGSPSAPFFYADQDVLNALLGTLPPESYVCSEAAAYTPFEGPLNDVRLLHHIMWKPWLTPLRPNAYSERMIGLLANGPVTVPVRMVPVFLREGRVGGLSRQSRALRHVIRERTRGRVGVRRRLWPKGSRHFRV